MNKAVNIDLADAIDVMEHLVKIFPKLTTKEKVDLGARLKAVLKTATALEDEIKDTIKKTTKQKDGIVPGELFKAVVTTVPTKRLDQKALKLDEPEIHAKYNKDATDVRVTYESR